MTCPTGPARTCFQCVYYSKSECEKQHWFKIPSRVDQAKNCPDYSRDLGAPASPDMVEVLASDAMKASEYAERHAHSLDQAGHVDYDTLCSIREVGKRLEAAARTVLEDQKQKLTVWINFYSIGYPGLYKSRKEADSNAAPNRIACIERPIEFEKGEGL